MPLGTLMTTRGLGEKRVDLVMERLSYRFVRWVVESDQKVEDLQLTSTTARGFDSVDQPVLFFENDWSIRLAGEKNKNLVLSEIAPRKTEK